MPLIQSNLGMTFRRLVVSVARMYGLADVDESGKFVVPSDPGNLNFCIDIVQSGVRRVVNDWPEWRWLNQRVTLALVEDTAEYVMPWFFCGVCLSERLSYDTSGPRSTVQVVSEADLREMESSLGSASGDPQFIAFYQGDPDNTPLAPKGSGIPSLGSRSWRARVYPTPSQARNLIVVVRANPSNDFDLDDVHPAGAAMDAIMESACKAEAEMQMRRGETQFEQRYQADLAAAKIRDAETGPRNLGPASDPDENAYGPITTDAGPLYLNGVRVL